MAQNPRPIRKPPVPTKKPSAPAAPKLCSKCQLEIPAGASFCESCGTPVKAGLKPRRTLNEVRRSLEKGRNNRLINDGRKVLLWLGILNLALGLIFLLFYTGDYRIQQKLLTTIIIVAYGLPGIIFLGLFVWAKTHPLPATISGLITYITLTIAGIALDPNPAEAAMRGVVIRILILAALGKAVSSAQAEQKARQRELEKQRKVREEEDAEAAEESESPESGA